MATQDVKPADLIVMGRIAAPYGVKGWVKVFPFTESPDGLCAYPRWWLRNTGLGRTGDWREVEVLESAVHGAAVVANLAGIADREAAALLKGSEVAVPRQVLPEPAEDEYYWADLIGLRVVNEQGEGLGAVAELFSNGAHDVMRVADGKVERLVPFIEQVVRKVDLQAREILVEWGLDW